MNHYYRYKWKIFLSHKIDIFYRYTWKIFLSHKIDTFVSLQKLTKVIQNEKVLNIASIPSDRGDELQYVNFKKCYSKNVIEHTFYNTLNTQQNGVL